MPSPAATPMARNPSAGRTWPFGRDAVLRARNTGSHAGGRLVLQFMSEPIEWTDGSHLRLRRYWPMSPEIRARSEGTGAGLADRPDTRQPAGSRRFTGPRVTRFDRLARSTCDLLNTLAAITGKAMPKKPYQWFTLLICVAHSAYFSKAAQNSAAVSDSRSASRTGRGRCGASGA